MAKSASHSGQHSAAEAEVRRKMQEGVDKLARAVKAALGPKGRNVVLDKTFGSLTVTKDAVTVAKEIEPDDKYESMGALLLQEAGRKTADVAGDGSTTATIIAEAVYREGLRAIASGASAPALTRGVQKGANCVVEELGRLAVRLDPGDEKRVAAVVALAAGREIGQGVARALRQAGGLEGVIVVEEGATTQTVVEVTPGLRFDRGYASPYFWTDQDTITCELEDCSVLVCEKKLANARDMVPLLEKVARAGKPLLIIADEVEGEALATLVINKLKGTLQVCAVKAPGYGDRRKAMLEDIAVLTGGQFISEALGLKLEDVNLDQLGRAKQVKVDKDSTTILGGAGTGPAIQARVEAIRRELEKSAGDYDREKLSERLAMLSRGVTVLRVGGATEAEVKQRKALYENALHAARAAVAEGTVPGGGVALLRAGRALDRLGLAGDEARGAAVLRQALEAPCRQIVENAGADAAAVVEAVRRSADDNYGYDVEAGRFVNLRQAGIVDPVKVTRSALQNGVSIACLMLSTEALVADVPQLDEPPPAPAAAELKERPRPAPAERRAEVIAVRPDAALCWLEVAGGARVKVRVPAASLAGLGPRPGLQFLWSPEARVARPLPAAEPAADDLEEFERLSREFRDELRDLKLRRDDGE